MRHRVTVNPDTVEILGSLAMSLSDPLWVGLDLSRAEIRKQSWLGANSDIHLAVPWCHPDDQTGSPEDFDCIYRVRPRMEVGKRWKRKLVKTVNFEQDGGQWMIVFEL